MQNSGQDGRTSPQQSGESSSKRSSTTDSSSSSNDGSNDGNGDGNGMSGSLTSLAAPSSFASDLVSPGLSFSSSTHIEFRNVSFRYVTRNAPVLTDFSLKVARGSTLALAGKSGCGELKNWCAFIGAVVVQRTLLFLSPLLIHLLLIPPLLLSLSFLRLLLLLPLLFSFSPFVFSICVVPFAPQARVPQSPCWSAFTSPTQERSSSTASTLRSGTSSSFGRPSAS